MMKTMSLTSILFLVACGASVAEPFEPAFKDTAAGTQANGCTSWPEQSAKVVEGEYDWRLHAFQGSSCSADAQVFEQTYDMDSRFAGLWQDLLLVDSGTGAVDHELYLVAADSGNRVAALWYVGKPVFGEQSIRFFEPTRDPANVDQCPQSKDVLAQWKERGMPVMRAVEKVFDRETGSINDGEKVSCYVMQ